MGGYMLVPKGITYLLASLNVTQASARKAGFFAAVHYLGSQSRTAGNSQREININNIYSLFKSL